MIETTDRIVREFEALNEQRLDELLRLYSPDARFKDPFHEVAGVKQIERIYRHMFATLRAPRFLVTESVTESRTCFLAWELEFSFRKYRPHQPFTIRGASQLQLSHAGLILVHRDYWDPAEEMYEKLPLIGYLMRWLKRRATATP